jgi:hypothetical protein
MPLYAARKLYHLDGPIHQHCANFDLLFFLSEEDFALLSWPISVNARSFRLSKTTKVHKARTRGYFSGQSA